MKNSECEIHISSSSKNWKQIYLKKNDEWVQIINGVYRSLTAEQLLSHILPLLIDGYDGDIKVCVVPKIEKSQKKLNTSKYLYRPNDYSVFTKGKGGKYFMEMKDIKNYIPRGYDYEVLINNNFIPCTKEDLSWLRMKQNQYYDYITWSSRPDGHGGCKDGTWEEYLKKYGEISFKESCDNYQKSIKKDE